VPGPFLRSIRGMLLAALVPLGCMLLVVVLLVLLLRWRVLRWMRRRVQQRRGEGLGGSPA
jgi:hypothetical protein